LKEVVVNFRNNINNGIAYSINIILSHSASQLIRNDRKKNSWLVFEHVSGQSFLHIKYQPTGCAADEVLIFG
jgi:hypothetical protein